MTPQPSTPHRTIRRSALAGIAVYVACLVGVLSVLATRPDVVVTWAMEIGLLPRHDPWVQARIRDVLRAGEAIPDGAILLLGDSIIERTDATSVGPDVHNLGIASLTTLTMAPFLPALRPLRGARAVVLGIGGNDLGFRPHADILRDYSTLLAAIPAAVPLIIIGVLPMNEADPFVQAWPALRNANIDRLNVDIRAACTARPGCAFLWTQPFLADATGNLRDDMHAGDGRHLSDKGSRQLVAAIRAMLAAIPPPRA